MRLILADSGSTKTDWAILGKEGLLIQIRTMGLNPWFVDDKQFSEVLTAEVFPNAEGEEFRVYFFGAGCGHPANVERIQKLMLLLGAAGAEVNTDLTAVARAGLGNNEGIAGILGTGANAGICRDGKVIKTAPSTGYILGDEGSAAWFGKELLSAYLKGSLPEEIREILENKYTLNRAEILDRVYKQGRPNQYIAGFARVLRDLPGDPYLDQLLEKGFNGFFDYYVQVLCAGNNLPLILAGSLANACSQRLTAIAKKRGFSDVNFLSSVIEGLIPYYRGELL